MSIFFENYGLFILILFCISVTSVEFWFFKEIMSSLTKRISNFQLEVQTKYGNKNWMSILLSEYQSCIICHSTLTIIFCGILTGIIQRDIIFLIIAFLISTPISLIIKLIYKFL